MQVTAPSHWQVISNGATTATEPGGTATVRTFATTPKMSTYLAALIAGPYAVWRDTYSDPHGEIPLGIFCRASLAEFMDAERLFTETKQGSGLLPQQLRRALRRSASTTSSFVPEFNAGAMENAGAVTFLEDYVFRSKVTRASYERRAETVLHEMAHMWFGDLVTMALVGRPVAERVLRDVRIGAAARPRPPIRRRRRGPPSPTWEGLGLPAGSAALDPPGRRRHPGPGRCRGQLRRHHLRQGRLRCSSSWWPTSGSRSSCPALRDYFRDHAFANATFGDLLGALEKSSGRDLSGLGPAAWLKTTGVEHTAGRLLDVDGSGAFTRFAIAQSVRRPAPRRPGCTRLAVGIYDDDPAGSGKLVRVHREELDVEGPATEVPALVGISRGKLILVNDDDLTYCSAAAGPGLAVGRAVPDRRYRRPAPPHAGLVGGLGDDPRGRDEGL